MKTLEKIVTAADQLIYHQGYEHTSFADIANAVQISRGNFYYHFKSKDEILDAVIDKRLADRAALLEKWENECASPEECIRKFINILQVNKEKIKRYGCPIGTLTTELAKMKHYAQKHAKALFTLFREWLCKQFKALGQQADADKLATHLLARSQGIATVWNAYQDERFLQHEINELYQWLNAYSR